MNPVAPNGSTSRALPAVNRSSTIAVAKAVSNVRCRSHDSLNRPQTSLSHSQDRNSKAVAQQCIEDHVELIGLLREELPAQSLRNPQFQGGATPIVASAWLRRMDLDRPSFAGVTQKCPCQRPGLCATLSTGSTLGRLACALISVRRLRSLACWPAA